MYGKIREEHIQLLRTVGWILFTLSFCYFKKHFFTERNFIGNMYSIFLKIFVSFLFVNSNLPFFSKLPTKIWNNDLLVWTFTVDKIRYLIELLEVLIYHDSFF